MRCWRWMRRLYVVLALDGGVECGVGLGDGCGVGLGCCPRGKFCNQFRIGLLLTAEFLSFRF